MPPPELDSLHRLAALISGTLAPPEIADREWNDIITLAIRQGLAPMLLWRIRAQAGIDLDQARFRPLTNTFKIAQFNYQLLRDCQSEVQAALGEARIPAVWIKGIALARTVYPEPALRPMDDLDLLVPYDERRAARDAVRAIGYQVRAKDELARKIGAPEHADHHYHTRGGPTGGVIVEVHFRLLGDDSLLPLKEMDWFWQESETHGREPDDFNILTTEAHLLYLSAHAILQHGEGAFRLQRYYDLHLLASQPAIDWHLITDKAFALGWTYAVERALSLARDYFATRVPSDVLIELKHRPQNDKIARARRLQGAGHRWEGTLLQLSTNSFREKMRTIFYLTFPPAAYMRARYAIPPEKTLVSYYLFRWFDAAKEIVHASFRRLR